MIAERINTHVYCNMDELVIDLMMMVGNAKMFNQPKSEIYKVN